MSYFIKGLEVLGGMCFFSAFVLVCAVVLAYLPRKRHRPPRRVWCEWDEVVLPQDHVITFTSGPFDWESDEWEAKFAGEGMV